MYITRTPCKYFTSTISTAEHTHKANYNSTEEPQPDSGSGVFGVKYAQLAGCVRCYSMAMYIIIRLHGIFVGVRVRKSETARDKEASELVSLLETPR